jgi:hypothetical protein
MATSFKTLLGTDTQATRTKLHEAIPITGTITTGTYSDLNIKNYSHGMFQSVYDYPYLSSSANHIFDITAGYSSGSAASGSKSTQNRQKLQMYNTLAQVLVGHDQTGSIRQFDEDGDLSDGSKLQECFFFNFSRLLTKDEIQKGSFRMDFNLNPTGSKGIGFTNVTARVRDTYGTTNSFKTNSPAGEYNILYATGTSGPDGPANIRPFEGEKAVGLIFYQAGIAVLTSSLFKVVASGGICKNTMVNNETGGQIIMTTASSGPAGWGVERLLVSASISGAADAIRNRLQDVYFTNTTELNSTIYFCRANANEFNYSSAPTYLSQSQIRVKESRRDEPISYITTVGLYSANNELLAVAKLSEPLKKTPSNEFTLRVRLDY